MALVSHIMYGLLLPILLISPKLAISSPLKSVDSPSLTVFNPHTSTPVRFEPVDPQFTLLPFYSPMLIDQDQWLVMATGAMGAVSALPLGFFQVPTTIQSPHPDIQVEVDFIGAPPGRATLVRFHVWGLYTAIRSTIELRRFRVSNYFLRWQGILVGHMAVKRKSLSLPGTNSTNALQQTSSSSSHSSDFVTGDLNVTGSAHSFPLTSPLIDLVVTKWGVSLPRYDIVRTIVEALYIVASTTPKVQIPDAIIVRPRPYTVELHIIPYATTTGQPNMTSEIIAATISQIPLMMFSQGQWREMHFDIKADNVDVAFGLLVRPKLGLGSSPNGTSII